MLAFSANVKAQYKPFKADKIKDSLWIKQLLEERHQKNLIQGQTTLTDAAIYRQGKVFYSPDKYLRMAQLKGIYDFNGTREVTFYLTVLQFRSGKNIIEKTFHGENNVLENPIINIYRLPGNFAMLATRFCSACFTIPRQSITNHSHHRLCNKC